MKFPVKAPNNTSTELTKDQYDKLTATEARNYGFLTHPAVVYEMAADKIPSAAGEVGAVEYSGKPKMTLDAVVNNNIVPVGTKFNGCEEAHCSFSGLKAKHSV